MDDGTDRQLLERARAGDGQALEALLERHQAQVYRFGLKMCRDSEDAKDVLQDTLLAMARSVRDFRGASTISTWLYTIARSFCIKKRRTRKLAPPDAPSLEADPRLGETVRDPAKTPDDVLASKQVERALEEAITALAPKYREALLLRDIEGLSAPEVAEILGISVQAVKSRLHRARLAVRAHVAPLLGLPVTAVQSATCPDVLTLFSRYVEGEISADVCAQMERHLEQCDSCRGTCDSLKHTLALCRTSGTTVAVPPDVQASVKVALQSFLRDA